MAKSVEEWMAEGNQVKTEVEALVVELPATREGCEGQEKGHEHTWERQGGKNFYHCALCGAFGFYPENSWYEEGGIKKEIKEMRCYKSGCTGWAVTKEYKSTIKGRKVWICPAHRDV